MRVSELAFKIWLSFHSWTMGDRPDAELASSVLGVAIATRLWAGSRARGDDCDREPKS